jgi:hypothetical protein
LLDYEQHFKYDLPTTQHKTSFEHETDEKYELLEFEQMMMVQQNQKHLQLLEKQ